jgi:drug/metabolite transporter (DMT)-like permease
VAAGLLCALGAAVLYGVAAVLQASGARHVARTSGTSGLDPRLLARLMRRPAAVVAVLMLLVGFVLHLVAVRLLPLFLAQAGIAVSLVVTALLAVAVFGERLSRLEWGAVGGVCAGLMLLSASAGPIGADGGATMPRALLGGVAVIAALAWPASRRQGPGTTAALGVLSGSGYAVVGIAARLLPGTSPAQLAGSLATYVLMISGVLAFFLYTLALARGAVALATTPLIVTQTVAPAAVGVLLLGDAVRAGWAAGAVGGFALTVVSASLLVRFEGAAPPQRGHQNGQTVIG